MRNEQGQNWEWHVYLTGKVERSAAILVGVVGVQAGSEQVFDCLVPCVD